MGLVHKRHKGFSNVNVRRGGGLIFNTVLRNITSNRGQVGIWRDIGICTPAQSDGWVVLIHHTVIRSGIECPIVRIAGLGNRSDSRLKDINTFKTEYAPCL
jgi:hypothetical protein